MSRLARARRALVVGIVAAAATVSMTQVANAQPAAPDVPDAIKVDPIANEVFLVGHAKGFQIYTCNGAARTWGPGSIPDAKLFDDNGELVAKHFGGPTWEAKDGSKVVGIEPIARVPSPNPTTAIAWLRLTADPDEAAPGLLANTAFIQRVATAGGVAPTAGCDQKTDGKKEKVPYTSDYYFWRATGA
jgi:hypothetical protein